jgi:AhpD family alkylhydroperoxidase
MPRVSFVDETKVALDEKLLEAIRARRKGGHLRPTDRIVLHSEPLARGWNALFTALTTQTEIDTLTRELVLLRVAQLLGGEYELQVHLAVARDAGMAEAKIQAIAGWRASDLFDARERAILGYAEEMTTQIRVSQATYEEVRQFTTERQLVELSALVGAYNMSCRFMEALELRP